MSDKLPRAHMRAFLESLGAELDGQDSNLAEAPAFFTELMGRFLSRREPPRLSLIDHQGTDLISIRDLAFHSLCEHHLVPFFGTVDIHYQPAGAVAGLGGFDRVVRHASFRPQIQERLTQEIADMIQADLQPLGLAVRCHARQLCRELTGGSPGAMLTTWVRRGSLTNGIPS